VVVGLGEGRDVGGDLGEACASVAGVYVLLHPFSVLRVCEDASDSANEEGALSGQPLFGAGQRLEERILQHYIL
jgi:hypothetical protein